LRIAYIDRRFLIVVRGFIHESVLVLRLRLEEGKTVFENPGRVPADHLPVLK
jgi:hypothetical protein